MRPLKLKNISFIFYSSSNVSFPKKLFSSTPCIPSFFPSLRSTTYSPHACFSSTPVFNIALSKHFLSSVHDSKPVTQEDIQRQLSYLENYIQSVSESSSISYDVEKKVKKPITELTDEELMRKMLHNASVGLTGLTFDCVLHLINRGVILSFNQWMSVFNAYRKKVTFKADVEQMMSILNHMESQLGKVPLPSLEVTLVRAAQSKMIDQVHSLLRKIQIEHSNELTVPVISAVMNVYHKLDLSEQALTFYENVPKTFPPFTFYSLLIKIHGTLGNLKKAETLYTELISSKTDPLTLVSGCSRMAHVYLQHQQLEKAKEIMERVKYLNLKLIPISYVVLVDIALTEGRLQTALSNCYKSMEEAKKPHFAFIVHLLLQKLVNPSGPFFDLKKAEALLLAYKTKSLEFKGKASVPYYPYAPLLEYYAQVDSTKALVLFSTIPGNPYHHDFAVIMMMRAFLLAGKKQDAEEFLSHCSLRGYVPRANGPTLSNYETLPALQVSEI